MNKEELRQLGKQSIDRFSSLSLVNPRAAIELELDFWEQEIFPLCAACGVSKYQFVIDEILEKVGFVDLTAAKLRDTVRRVRNKRAASVVSNPPEQAHRPITTPIAMKEVVAPLVTSQAPARPVAVPGATPKVKIEKDWNWREEYQRLRSEPSHDWTDQDEKIWGYLSQEGRKQGINPETEGYLFEGMFVDDTAKDTVRALVGKRKRLSINLLKA